MFKKSIVLIIYKLCYHITKGIFHIMPNTIVKPIKMCEYCKITKSEYFYLWKCGRCKNVYYCGSNCQGKDHKNHKPFCIGLNSFQP